MLGGFLSSLGGGIARFSGDADDIIIGDKVYDNSAWSYPEPKDAAKLIKGHVAFERMVDVER